MPLFRRKRGTEVAPPASGEERPETFLPRRRGPRRALESFFVRLVATGGIVGIGTAVAAIMGSQDVSSWIVGLAVSAGSVILAAILWSSRIL